MLSRIDVKFFKLAIGQNLIKQETQVDIAARCPHCSTDERWRNSKRLHLYTKNNITNVNCFSGDCPVKNKTIFSFLKDFYPALFNQYNKENFGSVQSNLASSESVDVFSGFKKSKAETKAETKAEPETKIVTQDLSPYFKKIKDSSEAIDYLSSRLCNYSGDFGEWYFGKQNLEIGDKFYNILDSIIIPLYYNQKMYGFYSRSVKDKEFSTYMSEVNFGYKVWNWFNIDKNEPVYIFEGIFDAISSGFKNIIALLGAKLPDERLKELKKPVFVLDNDRTGINNSLDYAKSGSTVYIQPDKYRQKDMNQLKLDNTTLNISEMIENNLYCGIIAEVNLKNKW